MSAMQHAVAISTDLAPAFIDDLALRFGVAARWSGKTSVAWLRDFERVDALVVPSIIKVPDEIWALLPGLRLICCFGTGFDGVPFEILRKRNIIVTHSPGANAGAVAELALGLLLAVSRRIAERDRFVRAGSWNAGAAEVSQAITKGLQGGKLGIVGIGAVGIGTALRAVPFGAEIGYVNPSPRPELPYRRFGDLVSLARWADFLVICARGDEANRRMIDHDVLAALGPEGVLVNVSRGLLVDEAALLDALENRKIAGAGLDVFESEPNISHRFMHLRNVVLSPHVAGRTAGAYRAMAARVIANLDAFFAGQPVPDLIPPLRKP